MARRFLHAIALFLVAVSGLCALLALGAWVFVHSPPGRRFVLRKLNEKVPGLQIDARTVSGSLFSNLILEDVTARPRGQGPLLQARAVQARYSLISLLRERPPRVTLTVRGGELGEVRADLEARGPLDDLAVEGVAHSGGGDIGLRGSVDALGRRADLSATFEDFPVKSGASAVTVIATGTARIQATPRREGVGFTAKGQGRYRRRDATDEHQPQLPGGGKFTLRADGEERGGRVKADFTVELAEAGQAARLLGAAQAPAPGHATVRGSVEISQGGRARLVADVTADGS